MNFYVDTPRAFWLDESENFNEHKFVYKSLLETISELGHTFTSFESRPYVANEINETLQGGIFYGYHSSHPVANSYCLKRSALPGLWHFDRAGYSGWCELANSPKLQEASAKFCLDKSIAIINKYKDKFDDENFSIIKQSSINLERKIRKLDQFLFCPLQVNSDEVMELCRFPQYQAIEEIIKLANDKKIPVVFKRHPLCDSSFIEALLKKHIKSRYVFLSSASIHKLIENSSALILANSGVGMQALIHGKQIFSYGHSEYAHMTKQIIIKEDLINAFEYIPKPQEDRVKRQIGYLLCEYLVDIHDKNRLLARVQDHAHEFSINNNFEQTYQLPGPAYKKEGNILSLAHKANKEIRNYVDFLLYTYQSSTDEQKKSTSQLLSRALKLGIAEEKIIKLSGESVWKECYSHIKNTNNSKLIGLILKNLTQEQQNESFYCLEYSKYLYKQKKKKEGLEYAEKAINVTTPSAEAYIFLGRKILVPEKNSNQRVIELCHIAEKIDENYSMIYWLISRVYYFNLDYSESLQMATKALDSRPSEQRYIELIQKIKTQIDASSDEPQAMQTTEILNELMPTLEPKQNS